MYVSLPTKENIGIYPISFGYDDFTDNLIFLPPRITSEYMLHFVVKGEGLLTLGDKKYPLKKGALFYCPPGVRLTYPSSKKNPYAYYWITFKGDRAENLLSSVGIVADNPVLYPKRGEEIERKYHELVRLTDPYGGGYMVISALYSILHFVGQDTVTEKIRPAKLYVARAVDYLNANFSDPSLKISHVAQLLHVSPEYLSKIFKDVMGISMISYLISLRLDHAHTLLEKGETVTGACQKSGYDDLANFSKTFKKKFGYSPSETQKIPVL